MAHAGHNSQVSVTGIPTAITGEALSLDSGTSYQITDESRQILDPRVEPVVYENGVATTQDVTIDRLRGIVYFPVAPATPVTVDATYLPIHKVAEATSFSLEMSRSMLDTTSFQLLGTGTRSYISGVLDVKVSFGAVSVEQDLYGTTKLRDLIIGIEDDDFAVIELLISDQWSFRAFMIPSSHSTTASVEEVISCSTEWMMTSPGSSIGYSETP